MSLKKSLFNFLAVVAIAACGGGGGGAPEPVPVPAPPPAPTASISASPTTVYVDEDITLTWSSTNASSCEASDSWEGSKDPSGEEVVTATTNGDLTYTITCSGNGSAAASVVVSAEYEPQFNEDPVVISNIKLYPEVCTAYFSKTPPRHLNFQAQSLRTHHLNLIFQERFLVLQTDLIQQDIILQKLVA